MVWTGLQSHPPEPRTIKMITSSSLTAHLHVVSALYPGEWLAEANQPFQSLLQRKEVTRSSSLKENLRIQKEISWAASGKYVSLSIERDRCRRRHPCKIICPLVLELKTDVLPKAPAVTLLPRGKEPKNKETRTVSDTENHGESQSLTSLISYRKISTHYHRPFVRYKGQQPLLAKTTAGSYFYTNLIYHKIS